MGKIRKTITVNEDQQEWLASRVESGGYTDEDAYLTSLIERDKEMVRKSRALRDELQAGLDSGVSDKTVTQIFDEVRARYEAKDE